MLYMYEKGGQKSSQLESKVLIWEQKNWNAEFKPVCTQFLSTVHCYYFAILGCKKYQTFQLQLWLQLCLVFLDTSFYSEDGLAMHMAYIVTNYN